jgi:hypothetical protein
MYTAVWSASEMRLTYGTGHHLVDKYRLIAGKIGMTMANALA